jgi:hypothetical protein
MPLGSISFSFDVPQIDLSQLDLSQLDLTRLDLTQLAPPTHRTLP